MVTVSTANWSDPKSAQRLFEIGSASGQVEMGATTQWANSWGQNGAYGFGKPHPAPNAFMKDAMQFQASRIRQSFALTLSRTKFGISSNERAAATKDPPYSFKWLLMRQLASRFDKASNLASFYFHGLWDFTYVRLTEAR
jgi:hypothetical protein